MADVYLGRYEAVRPLGRGSMGQVILAQQIGRADRRVVVKVMHDHVARQPRFQQLFEREIQYTARLNHPYAVRLLEASFTDPHGPCLVMEYIPGVTLDALLRTEKRLAPERVGRLLGVLCHALEAAHGQGIVHRDLKPANLMITDPGTPTESLRVMDFGLAQLTVKPHFSAERLAGAAITAAMGTPSYVCPEALRGDEVDSRSDLYSLGIILYEMLTGQAPFPQRETQPLLYAHVHEPPLRFGLVGVHDLPPDVETVVLHCLAKFPVERPQTARDLAERFGKALHQDFWSTTRPADEAEHVPTRQQRAKPASGPQPGLSEPERLVYRLDAWMPERIAVVKLGGFLSDYHGKVVLSEPGLLRVRIGELPKSGLLTMLGLKARGPDPVEIEFVMDKPNPNENRLQLTISFQPPSGHVLHRPDGWRRNCDRLFNEVRGYLIAQV